MNAYYKGVILFLILIYGILVGFLLDKGINVWVLLFISAVVIVLATSIDVFFTSK